MFINIKSYCRTPIYGALFFLLVTVSACKKDTTAPVLTLWTPTEMAFASGANITITGTATDESLHEMTVVITKDSDGASLFNQAPMVHDLTSYTLNFSLTAPTVTTTTAYTLVVTVADHDEHTTTKTVHFTITP